MLLRPRRTIAAAAVLVATLAGATLPAGSPAAALDEPTRPTLVPSDVDLPEAMGGARALRALGPQLSAAAAENEMTPDELRELLATDPTATVSTDGDLFYRDRAADPRHTAGSDRSAASAEPPYPLSETFLLHSKPGSTRTIFLDLDGGAVSGTAWNVQEGVDDGPRAAWDPAGDGPGFSAEERAMVQEIWARVAEDYAPFDVDVTTQDPGSAALLRSSTGDPAYGLRVLIGSNADAVDVICGEAGCGGVAWLETFAEVDPDGYAQPAWVFTGEQGDDPLAIAEAASHEAGHTFGLEHDGEGDDPDFLTYYEGHGNWAPVMGAGYLRAVTQWSNGSYAGANNAQDDVAVIAAPDHAPLRADEAPSGVANAPVLPSSSAYVTTRADVDVYSLGSCSGAVTVAAWPAASGPNLDVSVTLLDASGDAIASADPPSGQTGGLDEDGFYETPVATGLEATLSTTVAAGTYYVRVDGVGAADYSDYGSLGAYTVTATGCATAGAVPSAPTSLTALADPVDREITVTWSAPANDGGSPVTGYDVRLDGGAWTRRTTTSHTFTGAGTGAHTVDVRAVNGVGTGPVATTVVTMPVRPTTPGAVTNLTASVNAATRTGLVSWAAPTSDGGSAVVDYEVLLYKAAGDLYPDSLGRTGGATYTSFRDLAPDHRYVLGVRAVNAMGFGPISRVELSLLPPPPVVVDPPRTLPPAPTLLRPMPGKKGGKVTVVVRWARPVGADWYQIFLHRLDAKGRVVRTTSVRVRPNGLNRADVRVAQGARYRISIRAHNELGWGATSPRSAAVKGR